MNRQRHSGLDVRRGWLSLALSIALVGIGGVLLWASPFGQAIERQFGLELAFWMRGERIAPDDAIYIPVDQRSADRLCEPSGEGVMAQRAKRCSVDELETWARPFFASLVDRLADAGASVIIFDVNFFRASGESDQLLADAFARAGNVVLLSWIMQRVETYGNGLEARHYVLQEPAATFAETAMAMAPMPLPKDSRHDRYHTFARVAGRTLATLPTIALYHHLHRSDATLRDGCRPLFAKAGIDHVPERLGYLRDLRWHAQLDGASSARTSECVAAHAGVVARLFSTEPERYFNFYQGLGTFTGPGLYELLGPDAASRGDDFKGKVVFVGLDDRSNLDADDSFRTAFEKRDFSGVELAATAFVNLLHGHDIRGVSPYAGAMLLLGLACIAGLLFLLPMRVAVLAVIACTALFTTNVWYRFDQQHLLLPIVIPLFIQVPLMIALGWRWRLGELERITDTLTRFVPHWVKTRIAQHQTITTDAERLFGVCMHTDVAGYTGLSEKFAENPQGLKALEREYWSLIDAEITRENGERLEISGDGMLCVWTSPSRASDPATRACRAALAIQRVVDDFNHRHPETPFHTRIGVHAGEIALGLVGGSDRYTLTVGGDVANTAARIESDLNKKLGTSLLVSEAVATLSTIPARRIGSFVLRGKSAATVVYELYETKDRRF